MKAQTKSALLLFATLIVGVLLGGLGNSTLHAKRMDDLRKFNQRGGLIEQYEAIIQPTDAAQQARLRAVLERAEARFSEGRKLCRDHFVASRDSMRAELTPLLTPDQQARLDAWQQRERSPFRNRNGRDHRKNDRRNKSSRGDGSRP